jgi:hypothetical protein
MDELALEIHKRLQKYEVKGVPSTGPAGPPPPAPDEPSGSGQGSSAAPQGSAAPAKP